MPVWARLVAVVLIPLVGMGVMVTPLQRDAARAVTDVDYVQRQIRLVSQVIDVRFALAWEEIPEEIVRRLGEFGMTRDRLPGLLGFDVGERLSESRARLDAALANGPAVGLEPDVDAVRTWITGVRAQVDAGTIDADRMDAEYLRLANALSASLDRRLSALGTFSSDAVTSTARAAIVTLGYVLDHVRAGEAEVAALFQVLTGPTLDTASNRAELGSSIALYRQAGDRLATVADGPVREVLTRLATNPDVVFFDGAAVMQSIATTPATADNSVLAATFRASFTRTDLFRELVDSSTGAVVDWARVQRGAALDREHRVEWFIAAIVLLTVAAAFAISWSISRRLANLATSALRVSRGDLADAKASEGGPREVSVVAKALNDVVANLRQVEKQAKALAAGELGDDILVSRAPGELGESIQASVAQLSRAWQEREDLRERLTHQASHDPLTGLANRSYFLEGLERALARSRRHNNFAAVLFVDLDGFKQVNDVFGHRVGDGVLEEVGRRLSQGIRAGDLLARIGGDEFVVVAEPIRVITDAIRIGDHLIELISAPMEVEGKAINIGASIGVAMTSQIPESATDLVRKADSAVYRAKRAGRGHVQVFDETAQRELDESAEMESALRAVVRDGGLTIDYQPVCDMHTSSICGIEALVRWDRFGFGQVPPSMFIPIAEQSSLIIELGRWMLNRATCQLAKWSADHLYTDAYVSVNLAARHLLDPCVIDDVADALRQSGIAPSRLVLEVAETAVMDNLEVAAVHLSRLRALGARVALDDFGTGYTSIGQLWNLPIDLLKIDESLVDGLDRDQDRSIVEMMIEVGHTLGLSLVAEGVERIDQLMALRSVNCDAVQGYLIARPQDASDVERLAFAGIERSIANVFASVAGGE